MLSQLVLKRGKILSQEESKGTYFREEEEDETFEARNDVKKKLNYDEMPDRDPSALGGRPSGEAATAPGSVRRAAPVLICVTPTTTTSLRPQDYNEKTSSDHLKLFIHFYQLIVAELFFIYKHFLRKTIEAETFERPGLLRVLRLVGHNCGLFISWSIK